jgi:hypothetical protein
VGSFARGALQCGDLDLVFDCTGPVGVFPSPGAVKRGFVGGYAATSVFLGTCDLSLDSLAHTGIVFIPPLNTRGPNGAWLIERGDNHPLVRAFEHTEAWTLVDGRRKTAPVLAAYRSPIGHNSWALGVDLLTHEGNAQRLADMFNEDCADEPELRSKPFFAKGREVLELLAGMDVVLTDGPLDLALTTVGCLQVESAHDSAVAISSAEEVVALFGNSFGPTFFVSTQEDEAVREAAFA